MSAQLFSLGDPRYASQVEPLLAELRAGHDQRAKTWAFGVAALAADRGVVIDADTVLEAGRDAVETMDKAREKVAKVNGTDGAMMLLDGTSEAITLTEDNIALGFARRFAGKFRIPLKLKPQLQVAFISSQTGGRQAFRGFVLQESKDQF